MALSGELPQINRHLREIVDRAGVSVLTEDVDDTAAPAWNPRKAALPRGYGRLSTRIGQARDTMHREAWQVSRIWGDAWETSPTKSWKRKRHWKKARRKALKPRAKHDKLVAESTHAYEDARARAKR